MRVAINLATQPYEDARRFWFRWGGALVALAIVTLGLVYFTLLGWVTAAKDKNLIAQNLHQIADRDGDKAAAQALMNLPQNSVTRDRSQFLNALFYRKSFSWTQVFEELERVMPPRLHVISIQPEFAPDNELAIKLVVAGDSRDRALDLVRKMEESQHFQQTQIEQESAEAGSGATAGDTVKFNISALYVSGATLPASTAHSKSGGSQ
ncbi:MAG: PilN domain-containing protein [Terriglobales bacterium]|jgi:type IV pilus assembly protein PilN